jgi:hypothetical protein
MSNSKNYSEIDVENALADIVNTGVSLRKVALRYGIPRSTLLDRKRSNNLGFHGQGTTTKLSRQTEEILVHLLQAFADWGYGLTAVNVRSLVGDYLKQTDQTTLFKNGKPTQDWWYGFSRRWANEISLRRADNIGSLRAASCTDDIINRYFETCSKQFTLAEIDSTRGSNIWK